VKRKNRKEKKERKKKNKSIEKKERHSGPAQNTRLGASGGLAGHKYCTGKLTPTSAILFKKK
jgi:hypothetical protein